MENKKFITILTIVVVIGIGVIYGMQGMFASEEGDTDYGVEESAPAEATGGYGVSSSHPLAVKAGMEVLENGGNAADAAVTVSYVLGVVEPFGSGVGGGGEMLIYPSGDDAPTVYQYREVAPQSGAVPDTFGIPGFVKGLEDVHSVYGSSETMSDLIDPAVAIAEDGFKVDGHLAERLSKASYRMVIDNLPNFFPEGKPIEQNETLKQPELAETMKAIQAEGAAGFYSGPIADKILEKETELVAEDLTSYEAVETEPVKGTFAGYTVYSSPPPLAGTTLIQSLQMAEMMNVASVQDNEIDLMHLIGEISKRAYDDRIKEIGDPKFTSNTTKPSKTLTSEAYSKEMTGTIDLDKLSKDYQVNDSISDKEGHDNTTHFVIVDKDGTMVSATHTLGNFFGSGANVAGFFMNNQMENFSTSDTSLNSVEPGKTPRSFITPSILTNGDKTIGIGSPGGKRIPMMMTQVLVRHLIFDQPIEEAINNEPRFYIEDNDIFTEEELDVDDIDALNKRGYEVFHEHSLDYYGGIQALIIDKKENQIYGAADKRRNGNWQVDTNE